MSFRTKRGTLYFTSFAFLARFAGKLTAENKRTQSFRRDFAAFACFAGKISALFVG